ncbi:MAG: threonine/serine dehydratase [Deltaproteobacteria bacterium]|nr:MAG: threonine/serine dehydratase [Deltaproteobacteria bacterium]TMQ07972.1 MAG: threonine/serine dehydratase [Deltaproteobacteria bacterium]
MCAVDRDRIAATEPVIRRHIRRTPVVEVDGRDFGLGDVALWFKLELTQKAGSFKARGAFANLLLRKVPPAGVVAASGGNHGAAVALAARELGIPARIYVPTISNPAKVERIRASGAELVLTGERYDDALAASAAWAETSGALPIHAYDQDETMMGAGTLGLELEDQIGVPDAVLAAVGGGGLIGGIAAWFGGRTRVIGVEPELAPTLARALAAGEPVDAPAGGIAADSLAPRQIGARVFPIAQRFVESVLVPDEAIAQAQRALWATLRIVAEPGGAAALAAVLSGRFAAPARSRIAIVVSGANTSAVQFP